MSRSRSSSRSSIWSSIKIEIVFQVIEVLLLSVGGCLLCIITTNDIDLIDAYLKLFLPFGCILNYVYEYLVIFGYLHIVFHFKPVSIVLLAKGKSGAKDSHSNKMTGKILILNCMCYFPCSQSVQMQYYKVDRSGP